MKNTLKQIVLYTMIMTILVSAMSPVLAANPVEKCKITLNGQTAEWNLRPFLAYGPLGDVKIMIPMRDLFTSLGYTVSYDAQLNRSAFTADKNSPYTSFYIDVKTGQILKEGEEIKKGAINSTYLINNSLYVAANDYFSLDKIAELFLNGSAIEIAYDYVYIPNEDFITDYTHFFTVKNNITSLTIEISNPNPDHPFIGEQYTKYNTGEWIPGTEAKRNFNEVTLRSLWDGFDDLRFYTGKGERNELTGKGRWNSGMYAIAWELMDGIAEEINKVRKQNGLSELAVDHSVCFISVGAKDPKVDSVFDNAIHNLENNKAAHTYNGKTKFAECLASVRLNGEQIVFNQKYDNSTAVIARNTVNAWHTSSRGHKEIIMGAKYTTMGILVVITNTGTGDAYAVFK